VQACDRYDCKYFCQWLGREARCDHDPPGSGDEDCKDYQMARNHAEPLVEDIYDDSDWPSMKDDGGELDVDPNEPIFAQEVYDDYMAAAREHKRAAFGNLN
jgi:hypothetical protein